MTYITSMNADAAQLTFLGGEGVLTPTTVNGITTIYQPYSESERKSITADIAKLPDAPYAHVQQFGEGGD